MKRAIQSDAAGHAGKTAGPPCPQPAPKSGPLAQFAAMMNDNPRVLPFAQLREAVPHAPPVRSLMGLAEAINGSGAAISAETGPAMTERPGSGMARESPAQFAGDVAAAGSGPGARVLQGVFVYSYIHRAIHSANQQDAYYREQGFKQYRSHDGYLVWADPRNAVEVL